MKLTAESLPGHLKGALAPAYLICGDDPLRVGEAADAVRSRARELGFQERSVHFVDRSTDWSAVRADAGSLSLFGDRRILEIRMPNGKPGTTGSAVLVDLVQSVQDDTLLLVITDRLDRSAASAQWVAAIESRGASVPIWDLDRARLPAWLAQRCARVGLVADQDAIALLAARLEGNLLAASQEIDKLRLLVTGEQLSAAQVLDAVADSSRFDVFKLSEAALAGDAARALHILDGLRSEGVEPTLILWSLTRELRALWAAHSGRPGFQRPGSPAALAMQQAMRRAGRLPFARLCSRAARADRVIKGRAQGDTWDELLALTAEFCGVRTVAATPPRRA